MPFMLEYGDGDENMLPNSSITELNVDESICRVVSHIND